LSHFCSVVAFNGRRSDNDTGDQACRAQAMSNFETTATVEDHGQVQVSGVPFAPGTEVAVKISPKTPAADQETRRDDQALAAARDRMRELFQTIKGFRNSPRLSREDLYERGRLH
jgi:hypothetical protein